MSVPSATTTSAAEPSMLPASVIESKSISTSVIVAGINRELAPPGAKALSDRPSLTPPAISINSATVVPIGISNTSGRSMCPETPMNLRPEWPRTPCPFHQSAPRLRIAGTIAKVSTLLISVGFDHRPFCPG
jgi:hypothetical protein